MQPACCPNEDALVEHIKTLCAALKWESDPDRRSAILDELGATTTELREFIYQKAQAEYSAALNSGIPAQRRCQNRIGDAR